MTRSVSLSLGSGPDADGSTWGRSPKRLVATALAVLLLLLSLALVLGARPAEAASNAILAGFNTNSLPANDDGSTGLVDLPFPIDFFSSTYNSLYVNNNGNVTFNSPLGTYTPAALTSFGSPIIAPFWADVDTAVAGSGLVTYGNGTVDGHTAFGVNWPGVDCYVTTGGGLNYFQLLIIDRSDIAPGDFDIEFNYNSIAWDSGQASGGNASCLGGTSAAVGYTNGSTNALELNGSFQNGAFLDNGPDALATGSQNSTVAGRYIFPIRAGGGGGAVAGTVTDNATPSHPVGGALVSVCGAGTNVTSCFLGNTGTDGTYGVLGVPTGSYVATVSPPSGSGLDQATSPTFTVTAPATTTVNFTLTGPTPPPNGTTVTSGFGSTVIGGEQVPVINWDETSPITTHACPGGTVTATITAENSSTGETQTTDPVTLTEDPSNPGTFTGTLPAVYPLHGEGTVTLAISNCPDPSQDGTVRFTIYIDPSGLVVDGANGDAPIAGATVTLLSSDSLTGTFTAVPDGSAVMSPGNRANPDVSHVDGSFGWDTVPGFYEVEASKPGCGSTTSAAFQVPPPMTSLQLVLHCASGATTGVTTTLSGGGQSGTSVSVPGGTAVTDSATLTGTASTMAAGTVTYNVYSNPTCTALASTGTAQAITTPGRLPASAAVALTTPGTYY
jgi:Carboxypeptidase regulatory-like domain/Nidogen-like